MAKTSRVLKQTKVKNYTDELTDLVVKALQEKKGKQIVCLDLRKLNTVVTDMFIVCHADSTTQVHALARSVEEIIYKERKEDPVYTEGKENAQWILLDYINVVVHIFQKEYRDYYGIENLWADAHIRQVTPDNS